MKNVRSLITASLTFLLNNLIQTVSGFTETAQILITGNGSTTNTTSDGGLVSNPIHWGLAGLFIGASLLEMSALNYSRKIWQSENIEQTTKNYIHSTIQTVAMAGCCTTALRLGNLINPLQTAEFGLGMLYPNFLLADFLLLCRTAKGIREENLRRAQGEPVNDVRRGDVRGIYVKITILLISGIIQTKKSSVEIYNPTDGSYIMLNRAKFSAMFLALYTIIDLFFQQVRFSDIKSVVTSYFCCFLPCRRQPIAGAQQIPQNPLIQPLMLNAQ